MKKNYIIIFLIFFSTSVFAQNVISNKAYNKKSIKQEINCKLTVNEILNEQLIDIDQVEYHKAKVIAEVLLKEFNDFYLEINNKDISNTNKHLIAINSAINSADIIGMNYSMFDDDINFINSYKK